VDDFEGADHAPRILQVCRSGVLRIELHQPIDQRLGISLPDRFEFGPVVGVGRGHRVEAVEQRLGVEARSADHHRRTRSG
jgi:hypothetical protein